jgi:hypothetical protein
MTVVRKLKVVALCSGMLFHACKKSADAETPVDDDTTSVAGPQATTKTQAQTEASAVSAVTDVSELKLSSAFNLTLPSALDDSSGSSALRLTAGKRSQEACQMGSTIKETTSALSEVSGFFCHIEVEKEKIKFGQKSTLTVEGEEFAKIWIDDSELSTNKIRIGFCSKHEDGSSAEVIEITGLGADGPSGSIINKGSYSQVDESGVSTAGNYHRAIAFDMTDAANIKITGEDSYSSDANKFTRQVLLSLVKDGISEAALASRGTWGGQNFQERGRALFDDSYGSAMFASEGTHEEQTYSFQRLARFDVDGYVALEDASDKFATGGDLEILANTLPEFLAVDFSPKDLSGWVADGCPDSDNEISLDPESAEHQACDGNRDHGGQDCWNQDTFEAGSEVK